MRVLVGLLAVLLNVHCAYRVAPSGDLGDLADGGTNVGGRADAGLVGADVGMPSCYQLVNTGDMCKFQLEDCTLTSPDCYVCPCEPGPVLWVFGCVGKHSAKREACGVWLWGLADGSLCRQDWAPACEA